MHRFALWRRAAHCAVFALFLLLGSTPSFADPVSDLDARATAEYNRGLDARDAGRNGAACQHFRNAEALYHNSIMALSGMGYGHRSEEQLDAIKSFANGQQNQVDASKARAKEVCGRPDGPALTSSRSGSSSDEVDWNAEKKLDLQRTADLAHSQYKEADRLWDAGDRAGACAAIRLATANFDKISSAMEANPALRGAFGNPDVVLANGKMASEVRDKTFCSKVTGLQMDSLRRDMSLADSKVDEAKRLYEADDLAGSCVAARLSTDAYDRLTSAMRTDPTLRAAFEDPESVFENAKVMADHRDRFYCAKPG